MSYNLAMSYNRKIIIAFVAILALGFGAGYYVRNRSIVSVTNLAPVEIRANEAQYHFINPLLYLITNKDLYTGQYTNLIADLNSYINSAKTVNNATDISIYFRDLNTGHWTGIGENDKYRPGSMLKVVTLMATVQQAESGKVSLSEEIKYSPGNTLGDTSLQYYQPEFHLTSGMHTIQELTKAAVMFSDNGANDALLSNPAINKEFGEIFKLSRLPFTESIDKDFMSPRSYSAVWRTLYNATFLSTAMSDQVLQLLTGTTFRDGLVAGVPTSTVVSHKFGEYTLKSEDGIIVNRELHDCGIIYYPEHPYFLCVMTRGKDFPSLAKTIAGASNVVYSYVASSTVTRN